MVTAIREAGQRLEAIQRTLRPASLLAVYLLGQASLCLNTWLAGASLTTPEDRRGGRVIDDISHVVFKAVDL